MGRPRPRQPMNWGEPMRLQLGLKILVMAAALVAWGCSGDQQQAEEPVETQDSDDQQDQDQGDDYGDDQGDQAADEDPMEDLGEMDEMPTDDAGGDAYGADSMMEPEPTAVEPAPAPAQNSGGIISSGAQPRPEDECKRITNFNQRKACFARIQRERRGN